LIKGDYAHLFCPKCGKQVNDNAAFCPYCRAQLKQQGQQVGEYSSSSAPSAPILLTSNYAPGYRIERVFGLVYGITVRSRGLGGNIIAGLRTLAGGEIVEYTEMAHQARQQALDRLSQQAASMGANAVLSVMFDSTEIGNTMDEIIAFGTAVVISPIPGEQTQQLVKLS
jgi:uncharacterized protein YbjQ (UPF0145 family)